MSMLTNQNIENEPVLKSWFGRDIPFDDNQFEAVITLSASIVLQQSCMVDEVARVIRDGGEIFIAYLSLRSGIFQGSEQIDVNLYKISEECDGIYFKHQVVFSASDEDLRSIWSDQFDVEVRRFEFGGGKTFQSLQVVTGKRKLIY